jgi:hypothetical protein
MQSSNNMQLFTPVNNFIIGQPQTIKTKIWSVLFVLLGIFQAQTTLRAQDVTVTITGPETCQLATTMISYTINITFEETILGIVPARDLCACSNLYLSTLDDNGVAMGDIFIAGVNRGPVVLLTESGCDIGFGLGDSENGIFTRRNDNLSTNLNWVYDVSVRWNVPSGDKVGGKLTAAYKCKGKIKAKIGNVEWTFDAKDDITTELFPRKPKLNAATVTCATTRLEMDALSGTTNCGLGSTVGFQVEESLNGGNTWSILYNALSNVPRNVNYSPSNPATHRAFRVRMYAIVNGNTLYSTYSDIRFKTVDDRPTTVNGPSMLPYGSHTPFYSINGNSASNLFSFGGTGGGVNVSFLTSTNSTSVQVNVPPTSTGGYFTVVAQGTANCGLPYNISKGTFVSGPGFGKGPGSDDREQDQSGTTDELIMNYLGGNLEIFVPADGEKRLTVVGIDGRVIVNNSFDAQNWMIPMTGKYAPGVYAATLVHNGRIITKKFVVQE